MVSVQTVTTLINQLLPEPQAGLLAGILFGVKATMSKDLQDALIATGTLHIVALSGANISILTKLVSDSLFAVFRISRRKVGVLTVFIVIGFVWFVGPSPSVIRAAVMGIITIVGLVSGRQVWGIWSWCIACVAMLAFSPRLVTDVSFQLSAGATLGIILFGPIKKMKFLLNDLYTTLAAQVFTIPIILFHFHRISLISPLPNALIGWVMAPLMGLGYALVLAGLIWQPLGQMLAWVAWVPLTYIIKIVEITAGIPLASIGN